jgi:hypothetical protein
LFGGGAATGEPDAEHEGEGLFLAFLFERVAQVAIVLHVHPVELGELAAFLGDGAGGGIGQVLRDAAAQIAGGELESFVGNQWLTLFRF